MIIENCIIMKGIGGFYYVKTPDEQIIECKARGVFRKKGITPYAGDKVSVEFDGTKGTVSEICERKNFLTRPPVANIDKLIIVSSVSQPSPNLFVIDRLTAQAVDKGIVPIVVFSKSDLADASEYTAIYSKAGIESFSVSVRKDENIDRFRELFCGCVCALTGNTGVGKSSLLNAVEPTLELATGEISNKLGRGRHTTRSVELYEMCGGYIADTPGFSALDFENTEMIVKENLPFCFPEFEEYLGQCRFVSCAHTNDRGCAVCDAVKAGIIPESRHTSYRMMYDEVKDYREWQNKQNK